MIYPRVIGWLADGRLAWRDDQPWLDGRPLARPWWRNSPEERRADDRTKD